METKRPKSALSTSVLKAVGIFGGVQMTGILCSIVRTKLVAIWIGAVGVGLFGLYNTAIDMISSLTQLGIRSSAVREVAGAESESLQRRAILIVRRWSLWLGLVGALFSIAFAPLLSQWTFGNDEHTWGFIALSAAILFNSVVCGEQAILQGTERLKRVAKSSMWGLASGLAVSIPLFYYMRDDSIIPSIIAYSAAIFVGVMVYRYKWTTPRPEMSTAAIIKGGKDMVVFGIYMTISAFTVMLVQYAFMAYLNHNTDTATVGYFQAGWTITTRYVGLVFTAIAMEYYPRLTRANDHPRRTGTFVAHEMSMAVWLLLPLVTIFIACRDVAVWILYTPDFDVMLPYATWAMAGTILRAVSWCIGFVILARGDGMIYLITEVASSIISLALNIVGWELWGFLGLGIAYIVWYAAYTAIVWGVYRLRYRMRLGRGIGAMTAFACSYTAIAAIAMDYGYLWVAIVMAVVACALSFRRLKR